MLPVSAASIALPRHRLPADVAPTKTFRPFDAIDRLVGALLRLRHGLSSGADVEHPSAIGENSCPVGFGAGMEYFDALDRGGVIEAFDHGTLAVIAGIA